MEKDRNRCRKIQKDRKRYEKIAEDGGCVGECGFSCDVAGTHVLLNCRFPYLRGSFDGFGLGLVFASEFRRRFVFGSVWMRKIK